MTTKPATEKQLAYLQDLREDFIEEAESPNMLGETYTIKEQIAKIRADHRPIERVIRYYPWASRFMRRGIDFMRYGRFDLSDEQIDTLEKRGEWAILSAHTVLYAEPESSYEASLMIELLS